jgi:heme A synthase
MAAVVVQVFLAGLGLFGATDFGPHRLFAFVLHAVTLALVVLAAVDRRGALVLVVAVALAALVFVQGLLVVAAASAPVVGALHPVGALVLFAGARWLLDSAKPRLP